MRRRVSPKSIVFEPVLLLIFTVEMKPFAGSATVILTVYVYAPSLVVTVSFDLPSATAVTVPSVIVILLLLEESVKVLSVASAGEIVGLIVML